MPVPTTLADLSATASSNSPAGSESIGTSLDDYLRSIQAIIKRITTGADAMTTPALGTPASGVATNLTGTAAGLTAGYANAGPNNSAFSFRNKIIGGDFTVNPWQRGTSFTALAANAYGPDRWFITGSSDAVVDILKTADAPTVAEAGVFTQHCLHADVTTADASIAAGQYYYVVQAIEGLNAVSFGFGQSGTRYVTLSFYHKHTKTGTYCVSLRNSAVNRCYVAEYTQDVTDTWEKATITIPVDTSGTWLYTNGVGIYLSFALAAGATLQTTANTWAAGNFTATANQVNALDSTSNNFKIALVQLEAGQVATPFECLDAGTVRQQSMRYYYRVTPGGANIFGMGIAFTTTGAFVQTPFPVVMRAAPSALEQSGTAGNYQLWNSSGGGITLSSVPTHNSTTTTSTGAVNAAVSSGLVAGNGTGLTSLSTSAYLGWSAEL